jgi:hypothetical protein
MQKGSETPISTSDCSHVAIRFIQYICQNPVGNCYVNSATEAQNKENRERKIIKKEDFKN